MTLPGLDLLWFCQLAADGEFIGSGPLRRPTLPYLASLVETAGEMGFSSLLTATNYPAEHEAWTASVATLARTRGAGLLVAMRPGMFHPAIFAKMAATAANLFPGRLLETQAISIRLDRDILDYSARRGLAISRRSTRCGGIDVHK